MLWQTHNSIISLSSLQYFIRYFLMPVTTPLLPPPLVLTLQKQALCKGTPKPLSWLCQTWLFGSCRCFVGPCASCERNPALAKDMRAFRTCGLICDNVGNGRAAVLCVGCLAMLLFLQVDCTANSNTCNKYGVSGYPTLKIFRDGEEAGTYDGPRTAGESSSASIWLPKEMLEGRAHI